MLFDEFYLWANVGVSGIFGGLQIFFGVHHINLVRANSTTIELIGTRGRIKSKARQRTWDLGAKANMQQVASVSLSPFFDNPSMTCASFCSPSTRLESMHPPLCRIPISGVPDRSLTRGRHANLLGRFSDPGGSRGHSRAFRGVRVTGTATRRGMGMPVLRRQSDVAAACSSASGNCFAG